MENPGLLDVVEVGAGWCSGACMLGGRRRSKREGLQLGRRGERPSECLCAVDTDMVR